MLRVGLTGGIGSGKSTASNYLNELGAFVFDADNEAKKLLSTNDVVQHELISEFGTDIINPSGEIEKNKLSRIAFQDVDHQRRLNSVVHPYIYDLIDSTYEKVLSDGKHNVFIMVVPFRESFGCIFRGLEINDFLLTPIKIGFLRSRNFLKFFII